MEWLNILGGIIGLISFGFVAHEKLTKKPKIYFEITSIRAWETPPSQMDQAFQYHFEIDYEIGNVGNELTSILKANLEFPNINYEVECSFKNDQPMSRGDRSLVMAPGFATSSRFWVSLRINERINEAKLNTILRLKPLGRKNISKAIEFEIKK